MVDALVSVRANLNKMFIICLNIILVNMMEMRLGKLLTTVQKSYYIYFKQYSQTFPQIKNTFVLTCKNFLLRKRQHGIRDSQQERVWYVTLVCHPSLDFELS